VGPAGLEEVFRAEWARVVAALVGFCRDVDVAEDAAQEAFAAAARRWPVDGRPVHARAWLVTTGRRRALDRLRRDRVLAEKLRLLGGRPEEEVEMPRTDPGVPDERLELLFLCCHPTLRSLGGLDTAEIARAFLVGEDTMKRRLTRARTKIREAGIPFAVPDRSVLPARRASVLAVLYLVFNQGYGDGRVDLAAEAIRLGRILADLLPDEPEVLALLALMLLHDARRAARHVDGELVPLADQDRDRWDGEALAEGRALLARAERAGGDGPYAVQAAIAARQVEDPVDWTAVVALYDRLVLLTRSPVVALNRAVAVAEAEGPAAALRIVDDLPLGDYRYLHSTRAELLRRLGDASAARVAYDHALALATTETERRFLARRRAGLGG
jgi:RNA polymerase sigma-70 factor (ECF subfamily)